jgi:hypothetical protein
LPAPVLAREEVTPSKSAFLALFTAGVNVLSLILLMCVGSAKAQTSSANYTFLLASGFLCDPSDSGSCPAVAKSANGDSYEISGAGTFEPKNKSVKAAGTFNHKATNGNVLETGVWTASDLISFDSYGMAPAALTQRGPAFGRPQTGNQRLPMRLGPLPTGGLAIFRILFMPLSGTTKTAVLQVNCALGDVPRERSVEGIRIALERNNFEYSQEASGRVIFLALRPAVSTPARVPEQEARPEASEQPRK